MAAFSEARYRVIVVACGAQMGKTENLFNVLGHRFTDGPYVPALFIGPTEKAVRSMAKDRFTKMIASTKVLRDRLEGGTRRTLLELFFAGVRMGFGWPSPAELASHPAGLVLIDELDRMVTDVGGEGDPVSLASARTKNYSAAKIGITSTPTIKGASALESQYSSGTMGMWALPCPDCAEYFIPKFDRLWWPKNDKGHSASPREVIDGARLVCPHCGAMIENKHIDRMSAAGKFIYHVWEGDEFTQYGDEPPDNPVASFWISGICSPWMSLGELAQQWVAADRSGNNQRRQTILNTNFGEWWAMGGDRPEYHEVMRLVADYPPNSAPDGVQFITLGVDVQADGLFYSAWGWGYNSEMWKLSNGFLGGNTAYDDVWLRLTRVREAEYGDQRIACTFIDSGYRPGDKSVVTDHMVYKYCRAHPGSYPVKGRDVMDMPYKQVKIDVTLSGRTIKNGLRLFHVNTHYFKQFIYGRIQWPEELLSEPGGMHLDRETSEEFCRQLVSEELVIKPSGGFLWIRKDENHYLDCTVYAAAAAAHMGVASLAPWKAPEDVQSEAAQPDERYIKAPRKGYIKRR